MSQVDLTDHDRHMTYQPKVDTRQCKPLNLNSTRSKIQKQNMFKLIFFRKQPYSYTKQCHVPNVYHGLLILITQ